MSVIRCDDCDKPIDTDLVEPETIQVSPEDSIRVCEACAEKHEAEMQAMAETMRAQYEHERATDPSTEEYRQSMIDAGRQHLLPEFAERRMEMADMERKRRREEGE